ncbi:MAG: hypothetical protein IPL32_15020 [Chloracidobacterium sp.]|nr:hypothetical protein [Chloracidobacterium sp.]
MTSINSAAALSVRPFKFESYGVVAQITSNVQDMVEEGERVAIRSLVGQIKPAKGKKVEQLFEIERTKSSYRLFVNGEGIASCRGKKKFFKFFDAIMRITIGEHAVDRVFMHAGAVGWKGKGIIFPAQSYQGKSTIVTELVRRGADYYSDDFAIFDRDGLLHPFPRIITMRTRDGEFRHYDLPVESIGGVPATELLPVGLVLFTNYEAGAEWNPIKLTPGQGSLEMMPFVLPLRRDPKLSMLALNSIANSAIIARSRRGAAEEFADLILNFVDNNAN